MKPTSQLKRGDLLLGRYRIAEELQTSDLARVYGVKNEKAETAAQSLIAKVFASRCYEQQEAFFSNMQRVLAWRNPAFLPLHAFDFDAQHAALVAISERCESQTLEDLLRERGRLSLPLATNLIAEAASALAEADAHGIVHEDIRPRNLHVVQGKPRFADLGIRAVAAGSPDDRPFLAPEARQSSKGDAQTTIYALGALYFHAVTGTAPARTNNDGQEAQSLPLPSNPRTVVDDLPESVVAVIGKCLAEDRGDRYLTLSDLERDLQAIRNGVGDAAGLPVAKCLPDDWQDATVSVQTAPISSKQTTASRRCTASSGRSIAAASPWRKIMRNAISAALGVLALTMLILWRAESGRADRLAQDHGQKEQETRSATDRMSDLDRRLSASEQEKKIALERAAKTEAHVQFLQKEKESFDAKLKENEEMIRRASESLIATKKELSEVRNAAGQTTAKVTQAEDQPEATTPVESLPVPGPGKTIEGTIDLIRMAKNPKYCLNGKLTFLGGSAILGSEKGSALWAFPFSPLGSYRMEFRLRRTKGKDGIGLELDCEGRQLCKLSVGQWGNKFSGLSRISGRWADNNETKAAIGFEDGKWQTFVVDITPDKTMVHITADLDEKRIVNWQGQQENLTPPGMRTSGDMALQLSCHDSTYEIQASRLIGRARDNRAAFEAAYRPIVGPWAWGDGKTAWFNIDGGLQLGGIGAVSARWETLDPRANRYRVVWPDGWFGLITLDQNAKAMKLINAEGKTSEFKRSE